MPTAPRKYLLVTMFVALTDQNSGNSTPRCSKFDRAVAPVRHHDVAALPGDLVVRVHPAVVCTRSIVRPWPGRRSPARSAFLPRPGVAAAGRPAVSVMLSLSCGSTLGRRAAVGVVLCRRTGCVTVDGAAAVTAGTRRGGGAVSRATRRRATPVGRPAQIGDLLLEVLDRGERAVDAGETHVGDLVQIAQRAEDRQPDLVAGDLGGAAGADGLLHPVGELRQRVLVDGPALAGPPDAARPPSRG